MRELKLPQIFLTGLLLILLIACGNSVESTLQEENLITVTSTFTQKPTSTSFFHKLTQTSTPTPDFSTPTATLNPTQQIWLSTAIEIQQTKNYATQKAIDARATKFSEFPTIICDQSSSYSEISPDGEWIATSCGYKRNQTLIIQNKEGIEWVLEFKDFLHPSFEEGTPGGLKVVFWDSEDEYLYFTATVGWSGGGDFCFSGGGALGLFRLDLKTGSWTTLIDRTDRFPGDKIRFSSTGRRYAIDINGITITDLQTGKVVQTNANRVMDLIWSPDGTKLAYSTSRCNEEGFVIDSSLYIWDAIKNESRLILKVEKGLLYPDSWDDISRLSISSEEYIPEVKNTIYTLYEYDITQDELIFIGPYSILP